MGNNNKLFSIILIALLGLSAILSILFMVDVVSEGLLITWCYILLAIAALAAISFPIITMVQNPKGGGLSSSFGGGGTQQIGGVKKTSDFLDKSTWALATMLLVLILLSNFAIGGPDSNVESKALEQNQEQSNQAPIATPQTQSDNATVNDTVQN